MKTRLAAWLACTSLERRLLAAAWLFFICTGLALRYLAFRRVQALLRWISHSRRPGSMLIEIDRMAWFINALSRHHIWRVSCLERSMVLEVFLRRAGYDPEVRFGVCRDGETLRAHAWLEISGQPVGEEPEIGTHFLSLSALQAGGHGTIPVPTQ
jgi:hypothetical protein